MVMSLFGWLAYGAARSASRALSDDSSARPKGSVRQGTEADFRRDEERFAEDERRLDEADRAARNRT